MTRRLVIWEQHPADAQSPAGFSTILDILESDCPEKRLRWMSELRVRSLELAGKEIRVVIEGQHENWLLTTRAGVAGGIVHYYIESFADAVNMMQKALKTDHSAVLQEGTDNLFGQFQELKLEAGQNVRKALAVRRGE